MAVTDGHAQLERFDRLGRELPGRYDAARELDAPELVVPEWEERNRAAERDLLPRPPRDLLRHPSILHSMFVGAPFADHELPLLERELPGPRLAELLAEDPVGDPPLLADGRRPPTSANTVHQLHHLVRFERIAGDEVGALESVVEWGGGYGRLAVVLRRMHGGAPTHTIVDTPLFSCIQWLYLASVLGPDSVRLVTEPGDAPRPGMVNLVPIGLLDAVPDGPDLFVSMWALNESAPAAQDRVVESAWLGADRLLLGMHGVPLLDRAVADGATAVPAGAHMPAQRYVVR